MPAPTVEYTGAEVCPKCGVTDPDQFNIGFVLANSVEGKDYDFMQMNCRRCGYQFETLPMDAS